MWAAEALKLALADRDVFYADPLFESVPLEALLSGEYSAMRRKLIDLEHASIELRPGDSMGQRRRAKGHSGFEKFAAEQGS